MMVLNVTFLSAPALLVRAGDLGTHLMVARPSGIDQIEGEGRVPRKSAEPASEDRPEDGGEIVDAHPKPHHLLEIFPVVVWLIITDTEEKIAATPSPRIARLAMSG